VQLRRQVFRLDEFRRTEYERFAVHEEDCAAVRGFNPGGIENSWNMATNISVL
jgi:hypothetical protein